MKINSMKSNCIPAVLIALCSATAIAATPVVDQREKNQKARIQQGVKTGELTVRETKQLIKGQKQLRKMERRAKSDGVVTKKERAKLHSKANKESAKIKKNKHDKQDRN